MSEEQATESAEDVPAESAEASAPEEEGVEVPLARLTDRFLAYIIDALIFFIPARLTLKHASPLSPVPPDAEFAWHLMFLGAYVVYQTVFTSGERTTLGKKLMGLHVVTTDGEPLTMGKAFLRALGYIVGGACADIGFFWAFAHPMHRGWHDLWAGTVVVQTEERGPLFRGVASLLSVTTFIVLAVLTVRSIVVYQSPAVRAARAKLEWVAHLQDWHKAAKGSYTEDVEALAAAGGGGQAFKEELFAALQPEGFGVLVLEKDAGYVIAGKALDGTDVKIRGPLPVKRP